MRILYYYWDEFNGEDCQDAMTRLGHEVHVVKAPSSSYNLSQDIRERLEYLLPQEEDGKRYYDLVYTFDYYPGVSEMCQRFGMPYVSWIFDCPHYSLDSPTVNNSVNRIYVFDKSLYKEMLGKGVDTIRYSPLGVNSERLQAFCNDLDKETDGKIIYWHDVCFLGNLYDNEYNFYDQVEYLPEELKGYVDGVIAAQERFFGIDLFSDNSVFSKERVEELRKYINFENKGNYSLDYDRVLMDILRKKVTVNERHSVLEEMGKHFDTVLYTTPGAKPIEGVANLGMAHYITKMPAVFRRSKINLNITLRSILSGIPLRALDIMAAGGFLLTSYTAEIDEYFIDGVDLAIAMTPEEMVQKAAYYLEHEDERKEIARAGQRKVLEQFDYLKLLPVVLGE